MELIDLLRKQGGQYLRDIMPGGLLSPEIPPEMPTQTLKGLLGITPVVGDAISGYDAIQSAREGNYGDAALNGLGLLPFIPSMGGVVKNMVRFDVKQPKSQEFEVEMLDKGNKVGRFLFSRGNDNLVSNDAFIDETYRGQGYGKDLLLKAIKYAEDAGIYFEKDSDMVSKAQNAVYDSIKEKGLAKYNPSSNVWMITDKGRNHLMERGIQ